MSTTNCTVADWAKVFNTLNAQCPDAIVTYGMANMPMSAESYDMQLAFQINKNGVVRYQSGSLGLHPTNDPCRAKIIRIPYNAKTNLEKELNKIHPPTNITPFIKFIKAIETLPFRMQCIILKSQEIFTETLYHIPECPVRKWYLASELSGYQHHFRETCFDGFVYMECDNGIIEVLSFQCPKLDTTPEVPQTKMVSELKFEAPVAQPLETYLNTISDLKKSAMCAPNTEYDQIYSKPDHGEDELYDNIDNAINDDCIINDQIAAPKSWFQFDDLNVEVAKETPEKTNVKVDAIYFSNGMHDPETGEVFLYEDVVEEQLEDMTLNKPPVCEFIRQTRRRNNIRENNCQPFRGSLGRSREDPYESRRARKFDYSETDYNY